MAETFKQIADGLGGATKRAVDRNTVGSDEIDTPIGREATDQRATLLAAFEPLATAAAQAAAQIALDAIAAALAGTLDVGIVSGGGDATAANQVVANNALGTPTDAAATAGGTGTLSAQARLIGSNTDRAADALESMAADTSSSAVYTSTQLSDVTLSADTAAYASGDVIAESQIADAVTWAADQQGVLQSVVVVDKDDQKAAMTLVFYSANVSTGTENAAPSISDANAVNVLGFIDVAAGAFNALTSPNGYLDLGGVSVAKPQFQPFVLKPVSGDDSVYVAAINGSGTPTYTASGLVLRLGVI